MKTIFFLILFFLLFGSIGVNAQLNDPDLKKFTESIFINFQYPKQLRRNCIPTIALLKIDFDQNSKISNMDVSDSADMLFKVNFQVASSKFDKKRLEVFAKRYSLKSTAILIPYFIHLSTKNCPSPLSPGDLSKYQIFSNVPLQGNRLYTDPLITIEKDEYDIH